MSVSSAPPAHRLARSTPLLDPVGRRPQVSGPASRLGRSTSSRPAVGGMGLREMEEHTSKLLKQNFDLKLELFHRRKRLATLEEELDQLRPLQSVNAELREVNEDLLRELELRDRALREATSLICDLEGRVDDLEREKRGEEARSRTPARPSSFVASEPVGPLALRRLALRPEEEAPLSEPANRLSVYTDLWAPSEASLSEELPSPQLSLLSKSSFLSVYGGRAEEEKGSPVADATREDVGPFTPTRPRGVATEAAVEGVAEAKSLLDGTPNPLGCYPALKPGRQERSLLDATPELEAPKGNGGALAMTARGLDGRPTEPYSQEIMASPSFGRGQVMRRLRRSEGRIFREGKEAEQKPLPATPKTPTTPASRHPQAFHPEMPLGPAREVAARPSPAEAVPAEPSAVKPAMWFGRRLANRFRSSSGARSGRSGQAGEDDLMAFSAEASLEQGQPSEALCPFSPPGLTRGPRPTTAVLTATTTRGLPPAAYITPPPRRFPWDYPSGTDPSPPTSEAASSPRFSYSYYASGNDRMAEKAEGLRLWDDEAEEGQPWYGEDPFV